MNWMMMIAVALAVIIAVASISYVISQQRERRDRYMVVIGATNAAEAAIAKDRRADISKKLKQAQDQSQEKKKDKASLQELMQQAGFETPVSHYWLYSAAFTLLIAGLLALKDWPMITNILILFTAFFGMPRFFLNWKIARRQKVFLAEFADALDSMTRLLQAGMPMSEAVVMAAREYTGPLKEEMTRIYENQKIGTPIGEAALMMARRVPLPETHMFATAVQIQSETGSSLSEVLTNLSALIRSRFKLQRKVKALSSEAKSSAAIIAALPFLVMLGIYFARPEYIGVLFTTFKGKVILGGAGMWMSFGILIMRQMINFRI